MEIQYLGKKKAKLIVTVGSGKNRKRRTKTITYDRKRDVEKAWSQFAAEVEMQSCSDVTVGSLVKSYIENRKIAGIKATTVHCYEACERIINSRFETVNASEVNTYQLDEFVAEINDKYSAKYIKSIISLLDSSYKRAIRTGLLTSNPCVGVSLPKIKKKEVNTMNEDDIVKFLEALNYERLDLKVGYELALLCGLRRSEILGLKESDISLNFKTVSVHETRHVVDGEESIQDTKTERSRRTLALPDILVGDIRDLIELHNSYEFEHDDYLVLGAFGQKMNPSTFSTQIFKIEDKIGIERVSLHALRHTFATMLNAEGVDIARISAELGHSNINTTLSIYMHVFGGTTASSRGIADAVNKKFSKTATFDATKKTKKAAER